MLRSLITVLFLSGFMSLPLAAQPDQWDKRTEMIPMRDGTRLFTKIYIPKERNEDLPILMLRTPYGVGGPDDF
ncbi:MAG: CocE/NonD family hydrolase, partial [Cyclobacteriaceae bacterium]